MSKRNHILIISLVLLSVLVLGFSTVSADKITIAKSAEPGILDDRLESGRLTTIRVIMQSLVTYDRNLDYQPMLATDYAFSEDGMSVTFYLREGVTFHNGDPFTAEDVKYTIEWVLNPDNAAINRDLFVAIEEVEIIDDYEVVFHLSDPYVFIISNLARLNIYPHKYTEEVGDAFSDHPIGTGPFSFKEWDRGDRILLEANKDYWGGEPKVDYLEFRIIPDNSARLLAFRGGEVDMYQGGIPHEQIPGLRDDPRYEVQTVVGAGYNYIAFNQRNEYLADVRVRRAISHLIDREAVIEHILGGFGQPGIANIIPTMVWFNEELEHHEYNPEKARQLLEEAGLGDGGIELRIHTSVNPVREQIAELLQYELEMLGIKSSVHVEEWGAFFDRIYRSEDYEIFFLGWGGQINPDVASYRQFHSEGGRIAYTYYSNPRMDELIEKGRITPPNTEESLEIYREVQEIIMEDVPYAVLFYEEVIGLAQSYITGWEIQAQESFSFREAHKFGIED